MVQSLARELQHAAGMEKKKWTKYLNRYSLEKEDIQMASMTMNRFSASLIIREMQVKVQ